MLKLSNYGACEIVLSEQGRRKLWRVCFAPAAGHAGWERWAACPKKENAFCAALIFLPMRASAPCAERPPCSRLPCDLLPLPFRARNGKHGDLQQLQSVADLRTHPLFQMRCHVVPHLFCAWFRTLCRFAFPKACSGLRAAKCPIIDKFPKLLERKACEGVAKFSTDISDLGKR